MAAPGAGPPAKQGSMQLRRERRTKRSRRGRSGVPSPSNSTPPEQPLEPYVGLLRSQCGRGLRLVARRHRVADELELAVRQRRASRPLASREAAKCARKGRTRAELQWGEEGQHESEPA